MSIQLVVFPQNYAGYQVTNATPTANLVSDGNSFNSLPATASVTVNYVPYTLPYVALNQQVPTTNWKSFVHNGVTTPPVKALNSTYSVNEVRFRGENLGGVAPTVGIYQRINNLIPGETYELRMFVTTPHAQGNGTVERLYFGVNGAWLVNPPKVLDNPQVEIPGTDTAGWTTPVSFTASDNYGFLVLNWSSNLTSYLGVSLIEIRSASGNTINYFDGQVILDLYNEQEIPLTLSADTFTNAAEKQQSYSKNFNLPATKHNNKIFEFVYDITRSTTSLPLFNPYVQTKAIYKQNGITIFNGYLRLISIQEKKGERSYNVNLYSESTTLAELLKTRTFSDLSSVFNELTHLYNRDRIQNSWTGTLQLENALTDPNEFAGPVGATTTDVLRYPLCDWTGNIRPYASQLQVDAGAVEGMPALNKLEDGFRPWLSVKYLVDNIFQQAGYTYTSDWMDNYLPDYFMDFNWGGDDSPLDELTTGQAMFLSTDTPQGFNAGTIYTLKFPSNNSFPTAAGYNTTTGTFTATTDYTRYVIDYDIYVLADNNLIFNFGAAWTQFGNIQPAANVEQVYAAANDICHFTGTFERTLMTGDTLVFYLQIAPGGSQTAHLQSVSTISGGINQGIVTTGSMLNTLRGELNQWDFFKGLMTMFNLVILEDKDDPTNLIIEPYKYVYIDNANTASINPQIHDWTEKIDTQDLKLEPLKLKQTTIFQYMEDKDYPFAVYKNATGGFHYGSQKYTVPSYTLVTGEQKIEAKPFAATVMKPFFQYHPTLIAPAIYAANEQGTEFKGFENKPRIMFNVSGNTPYQISNGSPGLTYYIPYQNGASGTDQFEYGLFSHTDQIPSVSGGEDLNFGACLLVSGAGVPPVNNLYSLYYQDYYNQLYHPDTRKLKIKAYLTENDVSKFNFYDQIRIKNRLFRVEKLSYKPDTLSTLELILLP